MPQDVVCRQGRDGKINQVQATMDGQLVCTNLLTCICATGCDFPGKEKDGKINQVQATKRSVCTNLLTA